MVIYDHVNSYVCLRVLSDEVVCAFLTHLCSKQPLINSRPHLLSRLLLRSYYNSKNLNCIGALSFFYDLFTHFHDF